MDFRETQGREIARRGGIIRQHDFWLVPSQSRIGKKYRVVVTDQKKTCSCPDFLANGRTCKHIHAVIHRVPYPDAGFVDPAPVKRAKKNRKTYPQPWAKYNAGQTNEKPHFMELLAGLCDFVENEEDLSPGPGRPRVLLSDLLFLIVHKVYEQKSTRRFMPYADADYRTGFVGCMPHFNSINNAMSDERMTDVLLKIIEISSLPFRGLEQNFAADSSGFTASQYDRWQEVKRGGDTDVDSNPAKKTGKRTKKDAGTDADEVTEMERQIWTKVHLVCGVKTHIVTAVVIKDKDASDTRQLPELIRQTAQNFPIKQMLADKAYGSIENYQVMAEQGIDPFIPFKTNQTGSGKGRSGQEHKREGGKLWKKKFHEFHLHSEEFDAHYHLRSNVETVFSMVKKKFGGAVRSRSERGMMNEVLCKIVCHNICCIIHAMYELGLDTDLPQRPRPRGSFQVIEGGLGSRGGLHPPSL